MPNEKSLHLTQVVEAISLVKNAEKDWPGGCANGILREVLTQTEKDLQEELFKIMSEKKGRKKPETTRKGTKKEPQTLNS